jgi:hypothetical protein
MKEGRKEGRKKSKLLGLNQTSEVVYTVASRKLHLFFEI